MSDFESHVRAALRKKGEFIYNPYSQKHASRYRLILARLQEEGVVAVDRTIKNRWKYTKGPKWVRRPEKQK